MRPESPSKRGLVQVYTGSGKGKTTAAWGQALRAIGHGKKVAVIQFLKPTICGESKTAERLKPDIEVFGETRPYNPQVDLRSSPEAMEDCRRNFELARKIIKSGCWDMVVMDEINIVLHYGFISRGEMEEFLTSLPPRLEIVLTGRYAPDWLLESADIVTEMAEIKHPYNHRTKARKGIEY